jgi:hypothetical protein
MAFVRSVTSRGTLERKRRSVTSRRAVV